MAKLPINDSSIQLIPSEELVQFIGSKLQPSSKMPSALLNIHTAYNRSRGNHRTKYAKLNGNLGGFAEPVEFTQTEHRLIGEYLAASRQSEGAVESVGFVLGDRKQGSNTKNLFRLNDVKWLHVTLNSMRKQDDSIPYLHVLLKGCTLQLPENPIQERNPALEARCQRLKKQQEDREYHKMTQNVDSVRKHMPEDTIAYQLKQMNRHLIAVAQFLFSVAAGFAFGFVGIPLLVGGIDFGIRLLLGILIALIIAVAEIYFLAKKLNEEYQVVKPTQLDVKEKTPSNAKALDPIPSDGNDRNESSIKEHVE